jgi:glutamate/tyrosine decarboxylase-like PLP-dependent enzyme
MKPLVPHSYCMTRDEVIARLEALAEHMAPDRLSIDNGAMWRQACREGAALLRGPESEAVSLLRDILLLPANEQQLEYLHRGSGTATHFAVLLRAEKFLHSLGATQQQGEKT